MNALKLVRDTKKSKKGLCEDASSKRRFKVWFTVVWGTQPPWRTIPKRLGTIILASVFTGETCSLTFVHADVVSEGETQSAVGKQQSGDCLRKLQVFKFLRPDATCQKVLKELTDMIAGALAWPSSVKNRSVGRRSLTSGRRLTLCLSLMKARGTPNSSPPHFSSWKYNGEHPLLINFKKCYA